MIKIQKYCTSPTCHVYNKWVYQSKHGVLKQVSEDATVCVDCGYALISVPVEPPKPKRKSKSIYDAWTTD
jgi:hypothetical protein